MAWVVSCMECVVWIGRILRWLARACDGPTHSMRAEQRSYFPVALGALRDSLPGYAIAIAFLP